MTARAANYCNVALVCEGMRRLAPPALLALALAGCGRRPPPTVPATPPPSPRPARVVPGDIRDVAVLADGALVLADRSGDRADPPRPGRHAHRVGSRCPAAARPRARAGRRPLRRGVVADVPGRRRTAPPPRWRAARRDARRRRRRRRHALRLRRRRQGVPCGPGRGTLTPVAGSGARGYGGDGGPALAAALDRPHGLLPLPDGRLLLADSSNHRIREVRAGVIRTVAGTGREADLDLPSALSVHGRRHRAGRRVRRRPDPAAPAPAGS